MNLNFLKKIDLKIITIILLVFTLVLTRACEGCKPNPGETVRINGRKYEVIKRVIDTIYVDKTKIVKKPGETIYVDSVIYVPVPQDVDTGEILKEYYSKIIYKDVLTLDDSLGTITITDTISKNSIVFRTWDARVREKIIKEELIVKEPARAQLYVGGNLGVDKVNVITYVGPSILYKTKKDQIYSIGAGFANPQTISVQGGIYWKIKLRK